MPPAGWTNPIVSGAGSLQQGVDPSRLLPSRVDLLRERLRIQELLVSEQKERWTPLTVTTAGVIFDGHHAIRVAADAGRRVDVKVVDFPLAARADSVFDLPVRDSS